MKSELERRKMTLNVRLTLKEDDELKIAFAEDVLSGEDGNLKSFSDWARGVLLDNARARKRGQA